MKPIPYHLKSVLLALPAILIGLLISLWLAYMLDASREMTSDFPHYYRVGCMLREGNSAHIYDTDPALEQKVEENALALAPMYEYLSYRLPYLHPAYEAPVFFPLSFLAIRKAYFLWLAINVGVLIAIYRILLPYLPTLATMRPWIPFSLLLAFAYVPRAALFGQDAVILLLVLCGAFSFVVKGELFSAGVILGLGSFRFQHTLVIVALFLAWRAWKLAAGYFASGIGCALASLAVTGLQGQITYVQLLHRAGHWPVRFEMDNLRGVFAWLGIPDSYTPILLLCFLALAAFLGRNLSRRNQFLFAVVALTLGSYYLFFFDMAVFFLPVVMLLEDALAEGRNGLAAFFLVVFGAPVWVLLVFKVDQAQAMTAIVIAFFVVFLASVPRVSGGSKMRIASGP